MGNFKDALEEIEKELEEPYMEHKKGIKIQPSKVLKYESKNKSVKNRKETDYFYQFRISLPLKLCKQIGLEKKEDAQKFCANISIDKLKNNMTIEVVKNG